MKKMKRYSEGDVIETETAQGENKMIGDDTRARAMAAIAAGGVKDEEPAKPKKKKADKKASTYSPKSQPESDREENSAFMREFRNKEAASAAKANSEKTGFQLKKEKALEGTNVKAEEPKERNLPRSQAKVSEGFSGFLKRSMDQIGQEGRDQEARYKAKQAEMKESGAGMSPRMKAAKASEKRTGMRSGGSVSSASRRADGCATKGKTKGRMV
jgi:hypothetical protein